MCVISNRVHNNNAKMSSFYSKRGKKEQDTPRGETRSSRFRMQDNCLHRINEKRHTERTKHLFPQIHQKHSLLIEREPTDKVNIMCVDQSSFVSLVQKAVRPLWYSRKIKMPSMMPTWTCARFQNVYTSFGIDRIKVLLLVGA